MSNPFQFRSGGQTLFGLYDSPRVSRCRDAGFAICAPLGLEYMRTHYALRLLGAQLADAGFHVLRFDYRGTGDSEGVIGSGQLPLWQEDIAAAVAELQALSGAQRIGLIGLRAGAVLAATALAEGRCSAERLVLWDPVVSGRAYLESLQRMHAQLNDRRPRPADAGDELLGAPFPADLRAALSGLDLAGVVAGPLAAVTDLVVSGSAPEYARLRDVLGSGAASGRYRCVDDPIDWDTLDAGFDARMTGPCIRVVAEIAGAE